MNWTETQVARILARNTFDTATCCLPNCTWTGYEADLLVVSRDLRVIDVEIKLSKDDLKADGKKDKWWEYPPRGWERRGEPRTATLLPHPRKTWKHYYAVPKELWRDDWMAHVQPASGVLLVRERRITRDTLSKYGAVDCIKRARPNRDAVPLDAEAVNAIARLCTLRMWDTYYQLALALAHQDLVKAKGYQTVSCEHIECQT